MSSDRFSASSSMLGYLYQIRYALWDSLQHLRKDLEFKVSIETLDDVVFEDVDGNAAEILQTKHHMNRTADLGDYSPDLWKTLRIWSEGSLDGKVGPSDLLFLVTTETAGEGSIVHSLRDAEIRNIDTIVSKLVNIATTSSNVALASAFEVFLGLDLQQQKQLVGQIKVIDQSPTIEDLGKALLEAVYGFANKQHLNSFLKRLEGWWFQRCIVHLLDDDSQPILSEEIEAEASLLRDQFRSDSLPVDNDILQQTVDAAGFEDKVFVEQLRLISLRAPRIMQAIRDFYRAFTQRSRWIREDLLIVGELDRYERKLKDEWEMFFEEMRERIGNDDTEERKILAAKALYKLLTMERHSPLRSGITEASLYRGSYHMLSDKGQIGWHLEFADRLEHLLQI